MTNPANNGQLIGRLAQDIKEFANQDGSRKQLITIAVEDNFKSGPEKVAQTNFIQVENFVPAGRTAGGWDRVHKGDLVAVQIRIDSKPYTKDGETVYPAPKLVVEGFPTFLEPKSVTEARAAKNAVEAAAGTVSDEDRIAALEAELAAARAGDYETVAPFSA
jgi:single-stranded DNA-binding protein